MVSRQHPQRFYIFLLISFLLLVVLTGCDEFGLLDSSVINPLIQISLTGSLVNPGDEIAIQIDAAENIPDRISSRLEGINGDSFNLTLEPPEEGWGNFSGTPGELSVPDSVSEGYYTLVSEAWLDEKLLSEDRTNLYVLHGEWVINSLELFPPQSVPGGLFYVHVLLDIPDGSNPRLRWIQNDETIAEGLLSEGWDSVVLDAGSRPGVSSLTVELYPVEDEETVPLRLFSTELYTTESIPPGADNLYPPEAYAFLQHFDGKFDGDPEISGKPRPVITGDGMGFRFAPGDGISWKEVSLPSSDTDVWQPFSITVGVLPEQGTAGRLLKFGDEAFSMVLTLTQDGELLLQLDDSDEYLSDLSLPETDEGTIAVTLSFQQEEEGLKLTWLVDGDTAAVDRWPSIPNPPGEKLSIILGGEDGFSGIVTELALHVPGIGGDRFAFYRDTDNEMITAEGFEDADLQPQLEIQPGLVVDGGSLVLPPDGWIRFPGGGDGELVFEAFPADDSFTLTLYNPVTGKESVNKTTDGRISAESSARIVIPLDKEARIIDNKDDIVYELRASNRNTSDLRLESVLVSRE